MLIIIFMHFSLSVVLEILSTLPIMVTTVSGIDDQEFSTESPEVS